MVNNKFDVHQIKSLVFRYNTKTLKQGEGYLMICGSFSLHHYKKKIIRIRRTVSLKRRVMELFVNDNLPVMWIFLHHNYLIQAIIPDNKGRS